MTVNNPITHRKLAQLCVCKFRYFIAALKVAQNEAIGNAPSASVSQSDPSDRLRVQTRYLVNFLAPSVFWTRGLDRRDGCPALRNRLFPLLCLSHPNHIIYRFTSPATGARVSAAGKRHQQPETEIKRKYHAYYFFENMVLCLLSSS